MRDFALELHLILLVNRDLGTSFKHAPVQLFAPILLMVILLYVWLVVSTIERRRVRDLSNRFCLPLVGVVN
uniref:Uncharacterized protein n=1 Tax=Timema poppense TaxID=170557 RepID=A0A7R9HC32_TIMPO|nr:unnamed protein product [Timema poppensis]